MKKYDSYKDSGIEWIGEIPSHWEVLKFKTLFIEHSGNGFPNEMQGKETGEIPFYKVSNLNGEGQFVELSNNYVSSEDVLKMKWNIVPANTILTAKIGESLRKNHRKISKTPCIIDNNCLGIESKIIDKKLAFYLLKNIDFDWFTNPGAVPSVSMEKLRYHIFPITKNSEEQTIIANYLDLKTSQIDDLIAKKEHLIQLLEEERTAIINQAVTKGLDPSVPMKDSGIDWLGEIPINWEEARVKNVVSIIGRIGFRGYTTADLVQKGEGAISLSPSNIKNHSLNLDECTYLSWDKYNESPEIKIFENDIILVKTGSTIGKTAIIPIGTPEMTLNPQLVVFKEIKLNPLFLYYMMISNYFQGYFNVYTAGGSTPAISQEKINNFKITFPLEIEEQIKISSFISEKETEIKRIVAKTQQEIELLKEYKTALISEVVSGKVDVRNEK